MHLIQEKNILLTGAKMPNNQLKAFATLSGTREKEARPLAKRYMAIQSQISTQYLRKIL